MPTMYFIDKTVPHFQPKQPNHSKKEWFSSFFFSPIPFRNIPLTAIPLPLLNSHSKVEGTSTQVTEDKGLETALSVSL